MTTLSCCFQRDRAYKAPESPDTTARACSGMLRSFLYFVVLRDMFENPSFAMACLVRYSGFEFAPTADHWRRLLLVKKSLQRGLAHLACLAMLLLVRAGPPALMTYISYLTQGKLRMPKASLAAETCLHRPTPHLIQCQICHRAHAAHADTMLVFASDA